MYDISDLGKAVKQGKPTTEQAFTFKHEKVYRTDTSITLDSDGSISPDRLSKSVEVVKEPKKDFEFDYYEIIDLIEEKKNRMDKAFLKCDLPDDVDSNMVHDIIMQIRNS